MALYPSHRNAMKPVGRGYASMLIALVALVLCAGSVHAQPAASISQQIDAAIAVYQSRTGVPGVAVVVTQGTQLVHLAGYGHDAQGLPFTPQTPLPIASLSKSFTAFALMHLVDEGRIALDAPVRTYLPDFHLADPRGDAITSRQLLTHTSGMADQSFAEKQLAPPPSLAAAVAALRTAPLQSPPGAAYHYHNPNYWVAARLIEVVSGMSFNAYLTHHIFQPLGMTKTQSVASLQRVPHLAAGSIRLYGRFVPRPEPAWFLDGASGMVTTAADLAPWLLLHTNTGRTPQGMQLLPPHRVAELHAGLGWSQNHEDSEPHPEHSGWLFTFTAHQRLLPEDGYGIAIITNSGVSLSGADSTIIMETVTAILRGEPLSPPFPTGYVIDASLALLTIRALWVGLSARRRHAAWLQSWPSMARWRRVRGLLAPLLPALVLLGMPRVLSIIGGGRDISWEQIGYMALPLVIWLGVASVVGLSIAVLRWQTVIVSRRPDRRSNRTDAEAPI